MSKPTSKRHAEIQERAKQTTVLVVGDVMLNEHIEGVTERMSPESPAAPVLRIETREFTLGGAAQAAANARSLGAQVILAGVVGKDAAGEKIRELLRIQGIADALLTDPDRPTTTKTRIFRGGEHLIRIDTESLEPLAEKLTRALIQEIKDTAGKANFVIVSDYAKGVLSPELLEGLKNTFGPERIAADIKPKHAPFVQDIRIIKPNRAEAEKMARRPIETVEHAREAAANLAQIHRTSILLTMGGEGLVLHDYLTGETSHLPACSTELVDVTGAGDVVISTLAVLLAAEYELTEAVDIANAAAAVAVAKPGATTVTFSEAFDILERSSSAREQFPPLILGKG